MAEKLTQEFLARHAEVYEAPPAVVTHLPVDRTFEMPTGLYAVMVGLLLAYVGVMVAGFAHPEMILPAAIFVIFILGLFGVPAIWARIAPVTKSRAKTWGELRQAGVMTPFGRVSANDAAVQMLLLPALIFLWGVCVVAIAALV